MNEITSIRKRLPSPSLLQSSSIESLLEFSPRDVQKELSAKAPMLLEVLKAATSSCRSEPTEAVVAIAAAQNMCKLQSSNFILIVCWTFIKKGRELMLL